ncbi:hypothetical protein IMG5_174730 [Ichthyophthirius multifiliis]|uniref:Uncharacterized protein n=1 Tax=Ichthyophthirius multifiliis TaxID=5932 RepID=G0R237_ICHMU|nr:hypothetical protein IMG5_174730 [Ichthyophthirius multifiliis]EGR28465.1 hypothetical protein IMG5_174730 [Ichthyophthirius multifiliis]|eukprot:XP_004029701.1 hypothetical protein IMG5_174730 [Ichthyophthirius multifiliis]
MDQQKGDLGGFFESLLRKQSVKDLELEGKRVLLKVTLKIKDTIEALESKRKHENRILKEKKKKNCEKQKKKRLYRKSF